MKGCLFILLLAGALAVLVAVVGLPPVASGVVHGAVVAGGLSSDDLVVRVRADPPTDLIGLHADVVEVRATDATWGDTTIGRLEVTIRDVALATRESGSVEGTLEDVRLGGANDDPDTDPPLPIDRIALGGGGERVTATATVDAEVMEAHIGERVADATGFEPEAVDLAEPDRLTVTLPAVRVEGTLAIDEEGSLVLRPAGEVFGAIVLVDAADAPLRFTAVRVRDGSLVLDGVIEGGIP